jgi:hypothetical protein
VKKILIAALMAAFAATALPGVAAAQERDRSILLPLAAGGGTVNWIVNWPWKAGTTFKTPVKFKYHNYGNYRYSFKHHKKYKTSHRESSAGIAYVHGAIFCSALSPIITVAIEKRELSTNEVIDSTIGCFFPPYALIKMFSN